MLTWRPRLPGVRRALRRSALALPIGYTLCHNSSPRKDTPMREAVIVASSRTPLAKSHRGSFNLARPDDLAAHCIKDALGKAPQLAPAEVEEVILGCGQPHGSQGHN